MTLRSRLEDIEKRFPWSFVGFAVGSLLGIAGLALGLYFGLHRSQARLSFEIANEVNVLDVRQPLVDLSIAFQGKDLQLANLNLRVFTVKVENSGEVDILQAQYDRDDLWGITVDQGKFIESRLVDTNSDYVRAQLSPEIVRPEFVRLNKIIFERNKYFTLDLLVLHSKEKTPEINLRGKIAGIDQTPTVRSWLLRGERSIWHAAFSGDVLVQVVRGIGYPAAAIVAIMVTTLMIALGSMVYSEAVEKTRRKTARPLLSTLTDVSPEVRDAVLKYYVSTGSRGVAELDRLLSDPARLKERMIKAEKAHEEYHRAIAEADSMEEVVVRRRFRRTQDFGALVSSGVLKLENGKPTLASGLEETVSWLNSAVS